MTSVLTPVSLGMLFRFRYEVSEDGLHFHFEERWVVLMFVRAGRSLQKRWKTRTARLPIRALCEIAWKFSM